MSTPIDLSQVPPPDVVETLDHVTLVVAWRDRAFEDIPEIADNISEADPAFKWTRTGASRELLLRARVNDGSPRPACWRPRNEAPTSRTSPPCSGSLNARRWSRATRTRTRPSSP